MTSQKSLKLRCLIEREGSIYVAHCIDLCLGVQGDSVEEVKASMHEAIVAYLQRVAEIYQEGDHQGAQKLLNRKAPFSIQAKYCFVWLKSQMRKPPRQKVWDEDCPAPFAFS